MRTRRGAVALALVLSSVLVACGAKADDPGTASNAKTGAATSAPTAPGGTSGAAKGEAKGSGTDAAAPRPAVPSAGCGTSTVGALDRDPRTMAVAGEERTYLLTSPAAHDGRTPLPLVVDFHGLGEGSQVHSAMTNYSELAKTEGFVVAFPNGRFQPLRWDVKADPSNGDLTFVDQLLDTIGSDLCIDTSRVYATGLSYGAFMTSFMACERSDKFAAFAPVAGINLLGDCKPKRPVPVVTFHGTADPILKFDGGLGEVPGMGSGPMPTVAPSTTAPTYDLEGPGYPATVRTWAANNGCDPKPTDTKVSAEVVHRVYACPAGQDVEFYVIIGGGHAWPGSEFSKSIGNIVGYTTFDIDATKLGWQFLERFQLPAS